MISTIWSDFITHCDACFFLGCASKRHFARWLCVRYASSHELCVCAVLCSHFQEEAHKTLFRRKPTTYKKNAPDVRNRLINAPTKYYYTLTHKLNIQLYSPNIRFFSFGIFANNILYKVCRRAVNQNILFNLFKIAIPCNRRVRHKYINRWVEVDVWNRCRNDQ